jgi:phage-related protein
LKIAEFILKAAQTMIALPGKIAAYIGDHWKEIITFLVSPEDWWNLFKTLVEEFVDLVTEKVGPLLAGIGTAIGGGIRSAIATALSGLGSFLENTLRAGLSWLTKVGGPLVSVLDFFGAVPSGMKDVIRWLEGGGGGGETFGPPSPQQQRNRGLLGFARGVRNFAGGLAMVGERGAELVRLPRGSDVFRRADVGQALRGAAGGGTSVSAEVNITTSLLKDFLELKRLLLKEVDQKLDDAAARVGMTKPRYGTWGVGQSRI